MIRALVTTTRDHSHAYFDATHWTYKRCFIACSPSHYGGSSLRTLRWCQVTCKIICVSWCFTTTKCLTPKVHQISSFSFFITSTLIVRLPLLLCICIIVTHTHFKLTFSFPLIANTPPYTYLLLWRNVQIVRKICAWLAVVRRPAPSLPPCLSLYLYLLLSVATCARNYTSSDLLIITTSHASEVQVSPERYTRTHFLTRPPCIPHINARPSPPPSSSRHL